MEVQPFNSNGGEVAGSNFVELTTQLRSIVRCEIAYNTRVAMEWDTLFEMCRNVFPSYDDFIANIEVIRDIIISAFSEDEQTLIGSIPRFLNPDEIAKRKLIVRRMTYVTTRIKLKCYVNHGMPATVNSVFEDSPFPLVFFFSAYGILQFTKQSL